MHSKIIPYALVPLALAYAALANETRYVTTIPSSALVPRQAGLPTLTTVTVCTATVGTVVNCVVNLVHLINEPLASSPHFTGAAAATLPTAIVPTGAATAIVSTDAANGTVPTGAATTAVPIAASDVVNTPATTALNTAITTDGITVPLSFMLSTDSSTETETTYVPAVSTSPAAATATSGASDSKKEADTTSPSISSAKSKGLSKGAEAGIAIAVIIGVLVIGGLAVWFKRRRDNGGGFNRVNSDILQHRESQYQAQQAQQMSAVSNNGRNYEPDVLWRLENQYHDSPGSSAIPQGDPRYGQQGEPQNGPRVDSKYGYPRSRQPTFMGGG